MNGTHRVDKIEKETPDKLKDDNLGVNTDEKKDTPARKALRERERKVKKPQGGQKLTWIQLVKKDLKKFNLTEEQAKVIAQNRNAWRNMLHRTMSKPPGGMC